MIAAGVKETTSTTGTGTVTLSSVTGFARFADVFPIGVPVHYGISDGNNWEWGIGTVGASNTLSRDSVVATLSSGTYDNTSPTALTLSGSATVICTQHDASIIMPYRGTDLTSISGGVNPNLIPSNFIADTDYGAVALTANRAYFAPFLKMGAKSITALGVQVGTVAAGKVAAVGIFAIDPATNGPGKTLVETSGLDVSTATGEIMQSVTETRLPAGWYWQGIVSDGIPSIRGAATQIPGPLGMLTNRVRRYIYRSNTYAAFGANAFDNCTGSLSSVNNVTAPMVIYQ